MAQAEASSACEKGANQTLSMGAKKSKHTLQVRLGRRPGSSQTREAVIAAAKTLFAEIGYAGTTLRKIASKANVSAALVTHFFGSKDNLFLETLAPSTNIIQAVRDAIDGPTHNSGERVVRAYLELWENPETIGPLLAIARSTMSNQYADGFFTQSLQSLLVSTNIEEARLAAVSATLLGVAMLRYVLKVPPLATYDPEAVVALFAPMVQQALIPSKRRKA